jgi:hypothetical protein
MRLSLQGSARMLRRICYEAVTAELAIHAAAKAVKSLHEELQQ